MQVSVRSYLTAGTAAVVATGAIAVAPALPGTVAPVIDLPVSTTAAVALTGFDLPLGDIIGFLQNLGGIGIPTDILGLLPANFVTSIVTEFAGQATSLLFGAAGDLLGFVGTTVGGLLIGPDSIVARFGGAILNIPAVLGSAAQSLSTGDIAGTLQTLVAGLSAPLTGIGEALVNAATSLGDFVSTTVNDLVAALPAALLTAVQNVIGGDLGSLFDQVRDVITGLLGIGGAAATPVSSAAAASVAVAAAPAAVRAAAPESAPSATVAEESPAEESPAVAVDVTPAAPAEAAAATGDAVAAAPARARRAAAAPQAAQSTAAETTAETATEATAETAAAEPATTETASAEPRASRGAASGPTSRAGAHRGAKAAAASE